MNGRNVGLLLNFLPPIAIALVFFVMVYSQARYAQSLAINPDEGVNLIKSAMVAKGYHLYSQIWNDQPPVFTLMLSEVFRAVGFSIEAARIFVLVLSSILVACLYQTIRWLHDHGTAIVTVLFLASSAWFIPLSVAVMIGMPAIAMAAGSLFLANGAIRSSNRALSMSLLFASGLLFGLSIQTKIFTLIVLPAVLISLQGRPATVSRRQAYWVWFLSVLNIFILVMVFTGENWDEMLIPPLRLRAMVAVNQVFSLHDMFSQITEHFFFLLPFSLVGVIVGLLRSPRESFIPISWLATGVLVFHFHRPLRYHYSPMLEIPLCWLAAIGLCATFMLGLRVFLWVCYRALSNEETRPSAYAFAGHATVATLVAMLAIGVATYLTIALTFRAHYWREQLNPTVSSFSHTSSALVAEIQQFKRHTHWMYTDLPVYAFRGGVNVPPELAVITQKRRQTGFLSDDQILGLIHKYTPEQILIARFSYGTDFQAILSQDYVQIGAEASRYNHVTRLYVIKSLAER